MTWLDVLRERIEARGQSTVAKELGISPATVSLVARGKYPAKTEKIQERVESLYGAAGADTVRCPEHGEITIGRCAELHQFAVKYGSRATANPRTFAFYRACRACPVRAY